MKKWMHDKLRCPECLPDERPLTLAIAKQEDDDVTEGRLTCQGCGRSYPISEGVAILLPEQSRPHLLTGTGYNSWQMLSAYLWSHYSEFFRDPDATDAYRRWSSCLKEAPPGQALDIGCAVGRLSFELSGTHAHVIGIDTSFPFIAKARELVKKKKLSFDLVVEGLITRSRSCDLPEDWHYDRVEFLVADALALPFPENYFSTVASINLLEKVTHPRHHLLDINRVLQTEEAMFVFSDPFSWDENVSAPELWLGGTDNGHGESRGIDNMADFFLGRDKVFDPPFKIIDRGSVPWKIRKTENLWEHIHSQYIIGLRDRRGSDG